MASKTPLEGIGFALLVIFVASHLVSVGHARSSSNLHHRSGPQIIRIGESTPPVQRKRDYSDILHRYRFFALAEGQAGPEFELSTAQSDNFALNEQRGHWIFLNFVAPWCPVCAAELTSLEKLSQTVGDHVQVVVIVTALRSTKTSALAFSERYGLSMPVLLDRDDKVAKLYGVQAFPTSFLIGPNGMLLGMQKGGRDWGKSQPLFDALR